jgi:formylmethanofuran dehydrogenase subunit E
MCTPYQLKKNDGQNLPEQNSDILSKAIEFHGHLGPYLVLGLKAGLYANHVLGKEPMKTNAVVLTKTTPPESCFADGIQFTTGCTFGKGNISMTEEIGLAVVFKKTDRELMLKLKKEILEEIISLPSEEEVWEKFSRDLFQREALELFVSATAIKEN